MQEIGRDEVNTKCSQDEVVGLCWMHVCLISLHSHCGTDKWPVLICTCPKLGLANLNLEYPWACAGVWSV